MQRVRRTKAVWLVHVNDIVLPSSKGGKQGVLVCTRQLEEKMHIAVANPAAESVIPNRIDVVPELTERLDRAHFRSRRAEVRIGWHVGHCENSERLSRHRMNI